MTTSGDILGEIELEPALLARLRGLPVHAMLRELLDQGRLQEGMRAASRLMDGEQCCRAVCVILTGEHSSAQGGLPEEEGLLLQLLARYFDEPDDASRRLALAAAERLDYGSPVAVLAGAVGLLGPISPDGAEQEVRVEDWVVAEMAYKAILLASLTAPDGSTATRLAASFVEAGVVISGASS